MSSDRERLAKNLRVARESRGVTQTEAGRAVGKTRGTIVNWENPKATPEPTSAELAILGEIYGVSPKDLRFSTLERRAAMPVTMPEDEEEIVLPVDDESVPAEPRRGRRGRSA